uniref:Major facilitator superfamily (MFS) profile domain-containing protein n=1 Tax=Daphnia galeata TaxID=27404 RepID=A0A8J2WK13_9CRUS|nr:unnamed protein product [Daphnia galeata]
MKNPKNPSKVLPQLIVAVWGSWGYFSMGSVRGWSLPGIPSLNRTLDFVSSSDFQWISSFPMIGAVLGSLFINEPMQYYGRKKALMGHYFIFISGFLITGLTYFGKHKSMLYTLDGSSWDSQLDAPLPLAKLTECASPRIRGRLGSLTASSLALGILITYIIGAFVDWYILAWILGCLPILFLCGTIIGASGARMGAEGGCYLSFLPSLHQCLWRPWEHFSTSNVNGAIRKRPNTWAGYQLCVSSFSSSLIPAE